MGFNAVRKAAESSERREREAAAKRDDDFARRVATQQFLNQLTPIFRAHASGGMPAEKLIEGTGLRDYTEAARRLSVSVAARLADVMPNEADPAMVRLLLPPMGDYVARRIEAGLPIDVAADTAAIVAALDLVDPKLDFNPFERNPVSPEASLKMTAAAGMSAILAQLAWYDFRAPDMPALAARLLDAVMAKSSAVALQIAGDMGERDRISLMQSFVKHHSEIMASALAHGAAATLAALRPLDAAGREAWYRANDPVAEVVARFDLLTGGLAAAHMIWDSAKDPAAQAQPAPGA